RQLCLPRKGAELSSFRTVILLGGAVDDRSLGALWKPASRGRTEVRDESSAVRHARSKEQTAGRSAHEKIGPSRGDRPPPRVRRSSVRRRRGRARGAGGLARGAYGR